MVLAIDPGNENTAFVLWDFRNKQMVDKDKLSNQQFLKKLEQIAHSEHKYKIDEIAIECISSYGMAVGQDVFNTCIYIGILLEKIQTIFGIKPKLVFRQTIKMHHCHATSKVNDSTINTVLRQKYGEDNTVKKPNPIYWNSLVERSGGNKYMSGDIWAAFAVATFVAEDKEYLLKNPMEREDFKLGEFLKEYAPVLK